MDYPEILYLKHKPTPKLQRTLKEKTLPAETRKFIVRLLRQRRRIRRRYPTQKLRTMPLPDLQALLHRLLQIGEEDIVAAAPVITDILHILRNFGDEGGALR